MPSNVIAPGAEGYYRDLMQTSASPAVRKAAENMLRQSGLLTGPTPASVVSNQPFFPPGPQRNTPTPTPAGLVPSPTVGTVGTGPLGYNITPAPTGGSNTAEGLVPGPIGVPPNRYQGITNIYPTAGPAGQKAFDVISSELAGELGPETEAALWDTANRWGVAAGMPATNIPGGAPNLWRNKFMGNVAGAIEALKRQGLTDYNSLVTALSPLVDDPALVAEIANRNADRAAAPNPAMARQLLQDLFGQGQGQGFGNTMGLRYNYPQAGFGNWGVSTPSAATPAPANAGFPFNPPTAPRTGGTTGNLNWWLSPDQTEDIGLYGFGATPAGTVYNPVAGTSEWNPVGDPFGLGGLYGLGMTPDTSFNARTNQSVYNPLPDEFGLNDAALDEQYWAELMGFP